MPLKKNQPGCTANPNCRCATCAIAQDTFTRADNTNISANIVAPDTVSSWTESSGSWAIVSNTLQCTSAGIVICDDVHPDAVSTMVVEVDFRHDTSGSFCDVLVGVVDSTHYFYVRYKVQGGSGSIDIRRNNGGTHTSLALLSSVTMATNTVYTAKVCVKPSGTISAYLNGTVKISSVASPVTGTKAGLGSSGSGTATFDGFVLAKALNDDAAGCEECTEDINVSTCGSCCGASVSFTVEWPGSFSNIDGTNCHNCGAFSAGDYVLTGSSCFWQKSTSNLGVFEPSCTDGEVAAGGGDITAYSKITLTLEILVDTTTTPDQCYLRLNIKLFTLTAPFGTLRRLVQISYESPDSLPSSDFCSGDDFVLELVAPSNPYRDQTGWLDGYSAGCSGSPPSTITIHT